MKQRITYLLPRGIGVDPKYILVSKNELEWTPISQAAEERRVTFGLDELPTELRIFLESFHELHVKHISSRYHEAFSPLVSRLPPGLHISFTPLESGKDLRLCHYLKNFFESDLKCSDGLNSFSKPSILSERFTSSSTYQFYAIANGLEPFWARLKSHTCLGIGKSPQLSALCKLSAERRPPAHVDYDFDVISHTLTISILWTPGEEAQSRSKQRKQIRERHKEGRLEVGILSPEKADELEELAMAGFLTVVGEDTHPSPTLFSFPARHHPLPQQSNASYSVAFQEPTGLHPRLDISLSPNSLIKPKLSCSLHAYWTIPSTLFIDRYQLADPLFLESQNLVALRTLSGEQDLEAPDWAVTRWGSAALMELRTPNSTINPDLNWNVTIPTHLRYVNSTASKRSSTLVTIPWPIVFWACEAEDGLKMATNPFDRVNLGYDGLFGPKTMFYHIPPSANTESLVQHLSVPTLSSEQASWVSLGTVIAVGLGFMWICWQMFGRSRAATIMNAKKLQ